MLQDWPVGVHRNGDLLFNAATSFSSRLGWTQRSDAISRLFSGPAVRRLSNSWTLWLDPRW
jgi:hypothetical protein